MSTRDAARPSAPLLEGGPARVLVVRAPYYRAIVDGMTEGAVRMLSAAGAEPELVDVAGAFELPQAIRIAVAGERRFDGFVALGCVIRGETSHYDHICDAAMDGLMRVALRFGLALGTGLLTVENRLQAEERAGLSADPARGSNKGEEAAAACLGQIALSRRFGRAATPVGIGFGR